ncbi:LexA-binding, inner membrane-associated putative hydrolase [uncultured archaeon]|nr:LexA-binding, inner membrane-associated putative hydrolase [uncultured archaeon]
MDFFSHALLPYLLGNLFKRKKDEVAAFVIGGIAPDADIFIMWINFVYPTFFLVTHRGITHSLFFGFFTGIIILYIASRDRVKIRVRRLIGTEPVFTGRNIAYAYAGVVLHLILDFTTTKGVPLFYPYEAARQSAEVFFYTDFVLTILSLAIIIIFYKRPLQRSKITKFLIVFLVAFAILGAARLIEKTGAEASVHGSDIKTYPTPGIFDWYILGEDVDKITLYKYNGLNRTSQYIGTVQKVSTVPGGEDPRDALMTAGELPQVKMFEWRAYATAVNASSGDGSWLLEYYDPLQKAMMRDSPEIIRRETANWSSVKVKVESGKAVVIS